MITRKNFIPITCVTFTIMVFLKFTIEGIIHFTDVHYVRNICTCFIISVLAVFVLSLHKYLTEVSLPLVIVGQYVVVIGLVMLFLFLTNYREQISPRGYHDMFWSVTPPYVLGAIVYYTSFFYEIRKTNRALELLTKEKGQEE